MRKRVTRHTRKRVTRHKRKRVIRHTLNVCTVFSLLTPPPPPFTADGAGGACPSQIRHDSPGLSTEAAGAILPPGAGVHGTILPHLYVPGGYAGGWWRWIEGVRQHFPTSTYRVDMLVGGGGGGRVLGSTSPPLRTEWICWWVVEVDRGC